MDDNQTTALIDAIDDLRNRLILYTTTMEQLLTQVDLSLRDILTALDDKLTNIDAHVTEVSSRAEQMRLKLVELDERQTTIKTQLNTVAQDQASVVSKVDDIRNRSNEEAEQAKGRES